MVSRERNLIDKLGVLGLSLDRDFRALAPLLRRSSGVSVAALVADGPYWNAMLRPGDVIYAVNRTRIHDLAELRKTMDGLEVGAPVVLQLERGGKLQFVSFELE